MGIIYIHDDIGIRNLQEMKIQQDPPQVLGNKAYSRSCLWGIRTWGRPRNGVGFRV